MLRGEKQCYLSGRTPYTCIGSAGFEHWRGSQALYQCAASLSFEIWVVNRAPVFIQARGIESTDSIFLDTNNHDNHNNTALSVNKVTLLPKDVLFHERPLAWLNNNMLSRHYPGFFKMVASHGLCLLGINWTKHAVTMVPRVRGSGRGGQLLWTWEITAWHESLKQCWFIIEPPSATLAQQYFNTHAIKTLNWTIK